MYYRQTRDAPDEDLRWVELVTRTAAIAIERKHAEAALRESETRFRTIVNQATTGVVQADPTGRMTL